MVLCREAWESRWPPEHFKVGDVAQLGEHLPCKQGVKGSNPFISIAGEPERASREKHIKRGLIAQPVRAHA